ncbi:MAG: hypothetical protein FJX75_16630 [Armatimonadetes bacterium]|nr:hypothetical protein [Armatimonadota bacterium]
MALRPLCAIALLLRVSPVWSASVPVGDALRAELQAEWAREAATVRLPPNPSGEPQGAATFEDAAGAVDGVRNGSYGFHTIFSRDPWWQVDLQQPLELARVVVYNRGERPQRTDGMRVLVSLDGQTWTEVFRHSGPSFGGAYDGRPLVVDLTGKGVTARFVRCQMDKEISFHLDEVEVYGASDPQTNIALHKPADQSSAGRWSTSKLPPVSQLVDFEARAAKREAALRNPLLDFDDILFVKRHPGTFAHMCDQYYGSYARSGGGLYVLEDLRGDPRLRDLIDGRLPEGSYLSPDLSFDARRIAFAYVAVDPSRKPGFEAKPETCYHIYTVNVDGTDLRQVTNGPWDDFDPCWLPDGDLAFISSRRGGYCRCGARPVPTYTLHRMHPDGSAVRRLSSHETNEWHPSVANDGSLLYTRWDYVDRHTNLAHSLWRCQADGSLPFAIYGNYNVDKKPWGDWHPQPIPGSHKLMAIAGAHHGYAYGSLVMIDPRRGYDGAIPLERLTPEVPFPEAEGFPSEAYTTPFPLSEDLWLVSYSPQWSTRDASHTVTQGLYLQDRSGQRELLYRDPAISSEYALPLRPRLRPRASPDVQTADTREGRFALLNVYDSALPFPAGRIRELRVIQVLPKTTINADDPPISIARQVSARQLLGTVPVEEDGSAYFAAPAGLPVYFQAVGEDGMAMQTMRSLTYLQPGETVSCVGCHEPRDTTPTNHSPLALRRAASSIKPGPDGSLPFSYPRLVQPLLERHCVSCHGAQDAAGGVRLTGDHAGSDPYSFSYRALAKKDWVHWFDSVNGGEWVPLTTPGQFGARASRLTALLREGHEGVKLPPEDLERISLWIDLNVPFYGVYEPEQVAAQKRGEVASLDTLLP